MSFKNGVKSKQTAGYNGARTELNFDDLTTPLSIVHLTSDNRLMLIKADRVYAHFLKSSQSEKWAHFKAPSPSLSHARPDLHYIELGLLEPLQNTTITKKNLVPLTGLWNL